MSDYLIINGESLEVEKKFDKCVVEGFGNTTEDISTNAIIVPVGDTPGPTPPVDPFSGVWDLINAIPQMTAANKEGAIAAIQENIDGYENYLATSDGKQIVFTKDQNFCFVKDASTCNAYFGYKNLDVFPIIVFYCDSNGNCVVKKVSAPTGSIINVGEFQVSWVGWRYPSPEIVYGESMSTYLDASNFMVSATITSYYVASGSFGYSTGWSLSEVETSYDPDPGSTLYIWRGTISQYEALSAIDDNTTYVISNSCSIPYVKFGNINLVPTTEEGYECAIYNYIAPSGGSYEQCMIPIAQINRYPAKGWQLEFNVNAQTLSRDNVICGTGNATDGLREVYIKNDGSFWLYDDDFGDHQVYSGSITNKDVIIRRAIGSGSFEVIVDGNTVYTGTMSNMSNDLTLAVANYSGDYNFTGTINYLKFKWLE